MKNWAWWASWVVWVVQALGPIFVTMTDGQRAAAMSLAFFLLLHHLRPDDLR